MLSDVMEEKRIKEKVISAIMGDVRSNVDEDEYRSRLAVLGIKYLDGGEMKSRRVRKYCSDCHRYVWSRPLPTLFIMFGDDMGLVTCSFLCIISVEILFLLLAVTVDENFWCLCVFPSFTFILGCCCWDNCVV
mgnify:CR=1 FL=1